MVYVRSWSHNGHHLRSTTYNIHKWLRLGHTMNWLFSSKLMCHTSMMYMRKQVIGASLSEPHIDEFAVNFPYIYIFLSYVVP